ncbi:hypothetical protein D9M71_793910 [compost metagenome]
MGGGGDEVSDSDRRRVYARSDQSGVVRHVHHQVSADFIADVAKALEVDGPGIRRGPGDDHLRPVLPGQGFHFFVIERLGFLLQSIGKRPVEFAGKIHGGAVGQVTAVGQGHA